MFRIAFMFIIFRSIDQLPLTRNNVTPTFGSRFFGDKMHWSQWGRMQNIELALT